MLSDSIHERVNGEEGTADDDADQASHDDHKDRFDHGRNIINLFVELGFVD